MSKKKDLTLTIKCPEEKFIKHIMGAYGLAQHYKALSKVPAEGVETWLMKLLIEGSNQMYTWHNQQIKKIEEQMKEEQKAGAKEAVKSEEV